MRFFTGLRGFRNLLIKSTQNVFTLGILSCHGSIFFNDNSGYLRIFGDKIIEIEGILYDLIF